MNESDILHFNIKRPRLVKVTLEKEGVIRCVRIITTVGVPVLRANDSYIVFFTTSFVSCHNVNGYGLVRWILTTPYLIFCSQPLDYYC